MTPGCPTQHVLNPSSILSAGGTGEGGGVTDHPRVALTGELRHSPAPVGLLVFLEAGEDQVQGDQLKTRCREISWGP